MSSYNPVIEEFGDDRGRLQAFLKCASMIYAPTSVEIKYFDVPGIETGIDSKPFIVYPHSPDWDLPITTGMNLLNSFGTPAWRLIEDQYTQKFLLKEVLELCDRSKPEDIARFAQMWGPLWECRAHSSRSSFCFWSPARFGTQNCEWHPAEDVDHFRAIAMEIRAVLTIALSLRNGQFGNLTDWECLSSMGARILLHDRDTLERVRQGDLAIAKSILARTVNEHLAFHHEPMFELSWNSSQDYPSISINTGFGFVRQAWTKVAQLIANAKGVYLCTGCGNAFMRIVPTKKKDGRVRRPSLGKNCYCGLCGPTAAKRDSAARIRRGIYVCGGCGVEFKPTTKPKGKPYYCKSCDGKNA